VFPAETSINGYAFMRVPVKVIKALSIKSATHADGKTIFTTTKAAIESFDSATKL
jgi:hypothetical protein